MTTDCVQSLLIDVNGAFARVNRELVDLLESMSPEQWHLGTIHPRRNVSRPSSPWKLAAHRSIRAQQQTSHLTLWQ